MKLKLPRLVALLLAGLALPGCGGESRPAGEIVFAHPGASNATALYESVIARFREAEPDVPVRLLPISGDYYGKVLVLLAAREAPDVLWMGQGFGEFAQRGVFLDLEDRVRAEPALAPERVLPSVVDWYRSGGRLQGYPFGVDMDFIAYNEELFDAAAVPYPSADWSVDQFVDTARRLTQDRDGDGTTDVWGFRGGFDFSPFGAELLAAGASRADVATPEMAEALRFNQALFTRWKVSPPIGSTEQERADAVLGFQAGSAAMVRSYTFTLRDLRRKMAGKRWDIAPIPAARRRAHWASSQGYCISRDTRSPDAAWRLLRFLVATDALLPLAKFCLPVRRALAERVIRENHERPYRLEVLREAVPDLHPYPRAAHLSELLAAYEDACQRVYGGRAEPEAAMRSAAREMDRTLARRH